MNKKDLVKPLAILCSLSLIVSLTLVVMRRINWMYFWGIAILAAIIAWYVIPRLKK